MEFKIENITKKYGKNIVLNNFSYKFNSGLYLLTGNNGIGKSTLLKLIAKVIYPSNLNYKIDNIKTAYLCEKFDFCNINSYAFLKEISKINKIKIDVSSLMDKWKIPKRNIMNLSKGNKQKIAILMMMLTNVNLYLFDEPTDALDRVSKELFLEFIEGLIDNDKIVIIVTHDKELFTSLNFEEMKLECLD